MFSIPVKDAFDILRDLTNQDPEKVRRTIDLESRLVIDGLTMVVNVDADIDAGHKPSPDALAMIMAYHAYFKSRGLKWEAEISEPVVKKIGFLKMATDQSPLRQNVALAKAVQALHRARVGLELYPSPSSENQRSQSPTPES